MPKYASVYTALAGGVLAKAGVVISIGEVNRTKAMNEDDDLESAETGYSKKSPGMRNVDDLTLIIRHKKGDPGQGVFDSSYDNDELIDVEIRYPDAEKTSVKFTGYASAISLNAQDKDTIRMERTITISVDGGLTESTWTEAQA